MKIALADLKRGRWSKSLQADVCPRVKVIGTLDKAGDSFADGRRVMLVLAREECCPLAYRTENHTIRLPRTRPVRLEIVQVEANQTHSGNSNISSPCLTRNFSTIDADVLTSRKVQVDE